MRGARHGTISRARKRKAISSVPDHVRLPAKVVAVGRRTKSGRIERSRSNGAAACAARSGHRILDAML